MQHKNFRKPGKNGPQGKTPGGAQGKAQRNAPGNNIQGKSSGKSPGSSAGKAAAGSGKSGYVPKNGPRKPSQRDVQRAQQKNPHKVKKGPKVPPRSSAGGAGPQRPAKAWNAPGSRPYSSSRPSSASSSRPSSDAAKPWERTASPGRLERSQRGDRTFLPKNLPRSMQSQAPGKNVVPGRATYGHTVPPTRTRLEELLAQYGVTLPGPVLDKVWQYHGILRKNNGDLDLTRLIGFETIVQRHYADCLILHKMMNGKWPSPLVDIGTGAGFPGLMIKLASPSTTMILSEPRNVRVDFLNNTIQEMGLKDISVFGHKFTSKSFQTPVQGVITRAFEPIGKTLPRLQYSLAVGGLAIFMKGPGVDEELSAPLPSNYKLVRDERYRIPRTTLDRALVVFERIA